MIAYIVRRILLTVPILFFVVTLVFFLLRVAPGDPAMVILGDYASQEALDGFRERMGLNAPMHVQYMRYLNGLVHGDLGRSLITGKPVSELFGHVLPYSLELVAGGVLVGIILGIPLGIVTALHRNRPFDYIGRILSLAGLSIPTFYLGILLMLLFAVYWRIFPVVGAGDLNNPLDNLHHLVLPVLTLGLIMTAYITRVARSSILNVLNEDYIQVARSKGLIEERVIYKHALKNALIPLVSFIGVYTILLVGGSVMIEVVFNRPGLGSTLVRAAGQRDYMVLQGLMSFYAFLVVLVNLITDVAYGIIDPRIRYG